MNRSTFSLFVALLVHLLFLLLFWLLGTVAPDVKNQKKEEHKIKISLKDLPIKHKESGVNKKKPKPQIKAPPMPKGKQLKKIVKTSKMIKYKPTKTTKKTTLNKPKSKPKKVVKADTKRESLASETKFLPPKEVKDPMAWIYEDKSSDEQKIKKLKTSTGGSVSQDVRKLYGNKFGKLTPGQQQYIIDNQEIMRRITQQVLSRVARVNLPNDLNVDRNNVVEFKIHPNGDMTDFKFLSKSGYYVLDDTTKETIEYAYSRYPKPTETTLIRYNVYYNLSRY